MSQGNNTRVVSMFPRSNTGHPSTAKRPLANGEPSEQDTKRHQRLQKGPQAIPKNVSSLLPRDVRNPWERYQKVFKIDQAGPGYIAHAKNNTFAEMIVKEVKAPSKDWLTKLTPTSNQNVVHLQEAMYNNGCIYLFYEVMDVSLSQAFATPLGRWKAYEVAAFSQELLNGLDYIHKSLGLVHGDMSAKSVLLSVEGAVKIGNKPTKAPCTVANILQRILVRVCSRNLVRRQHRTIFAQLEELLLNVLSRVPFWKMGTL